MQLFVRSNLMPKVYMRYVSNLDLCMASAHFRLMCSSTRFVPTEPKYVAVWSLQRERERKRKSKDHEIMLNERRMRKNQVTADRYHVKMRMV